jgi:hypothetical protein
MMPIGPVVSMKKSGLVFLLLMLGGWIPGTYRVAQAYPRQQTASAPGSSSTPPAQAVPVMDGGAGPCSVELTVTSEGGKPVEGAEVKVHIAYGFAGIRRLDLEAYTGTQGKVKFTGLPARVHQPPLEFRASKGQVTGMATYDPQLECRAKHDIPLDRRESQN